MQLSEHKRKAHKIRQTTHLWKLEDSKLINKSNFWKSNDSWNFFTKGTLVYIKNVTQNKVLGITDDSAGKTVIEENLDSNEFGQMWEKGIVNEDGYFTFTNLRLS